MVIKFILFLQNLIKKNLNKSQILNYRPAGGFLKEDQDIVFNAETIFCQGI